MTTYECGTVVLVHFPQSGTTIRKQRPGVVLDIGDADLVLAPVTSQPRNQAGDEGMKGVVHHALAPPAEPVADPPLAAGTITKPPRHTECACYEMAKKS